MLETREKTISKLASELQQAKQEIANHIAVNSLLTDSEGEADLANKLYQATSELQQKDEWISVKDNLPSDNMPCFLCGVDKILDDGTIMYFRTIGSLCEGTDAKNNKIAYWVDWNHEAMIDDVSHWMPLPEPPKAK